MGLRGAWCQTDKHKIQMQHETTKTLNFLQKLPEYVMQHLDRSTQDIPMCAMEVVKQSRHL